MPHRVSARGTKTVGEGGEGLPHRCGGAPSLAAVLVAERVTFVAGDPTFLLPALSLGLEEEALADGRAVGLHRKL